MAIKGTDVSGTEQMSLFVNLPLDLICVYILIISNNNLTKEICKMQNTT